jgi:hypothetical protein
MDLDIDGRRGRAASTRPSVFRDGVDGNARLTGLTALVLLLLLAAEGVTIPLIHSQLTLHIFLGVVLIPVVVLKTAATAWRFARYYSREPSYLAKGPPPAFLRILVAPLVVASTAGLFGTGVLLIALHPQRGLLVGLHKASFIVWFAAMGAHVLGHVLKLPGLVRADVDRTLPGSRLRQLVVAGSIVAGLIVAVTTLPLAHDWVHWAALHHHHDG